MVSGTSSHVNTKKKKINPANTKKVYFPSAVCIEGNANATPKFVSQLTVVATLIAYPRVLEGNVSAIMNQGIGPNPTANELTKRSTPATKIISPILPICPLNIIDRATIKIKMNSPI